MGLDAREKATIDLRAVVVETRGLQWATEKHVVEQVLCRRPGVYRLICDIPQLRLYMGHYTLSTYLSEGKGGRAIQQLAQICPFEVVMPRQRPEWPWQEGTSAYEIEYQKTVEQIRRNKGLA